MRELYQQLIIDHGRKPRNYGELDNATHQKEGFNPLCGDKLTVYLIVNDEIIQDMHFVGCGCAISMASASLMTESLKGKTLTEVQELFDEFHEVVLGEKQPDEKMGKLAVLVGVADYPSRVKCATLCWHTMKAALEHKEARVSTE